MSKTLDESTKSQEGKISLKDQRGGRATDALEKHTHEASTQVRVDDSQVTAMYANFCRVTGTPEELIVDFGLNPQPFGSTTEPIAVTQRIVVNFFTAKRLMAALQMTMQRHEGTFGVLETDVQKRVLPGVWRQQSQG